MPRVQITLPELFHYTTELPIRVHEINYGNHLGNDAVLSLVHEARMRFLQHYGYSELDLDGVGIIMVDAAVKYLSEGFWGETIAIQVAVTDIGNSGFDLVYKLVNKTRGKDLAYAKTGIVCFDYEQREIRRLPVSFKQKFKLD